VTRQQQLLGVNPCSVRRRTLGFPLDERPQPALRIDWRHHDLLVFGETRGTGRAQNTSSASAGRDTTPRCLPSRALGIRSQLKALKAENIQIGTLAGIAYAIGRRSR
jgi:hypothetical protein